jgi:hypothetical protein
MDRSWPTATLLLVTYLRVMTKRLIEAKQDSQASSYRLEDKDFLVDILKHLGPDSARKDKTWLPLLDTLAECSGMAWAECCFQVLKRFHVTVTPRELADDFKSNRQKVGNTRRRNMSTT